MIASILDNHSHTLADLAESCGIDFHKAKHLLYRETYGKKPHTGNFHVSKEYRNKVYIFVRHNEYAGKIYPTIRFGTLKHGGITEIFNGYREVMAAKGYSDAYIQKQQPKPALAPKKPAPAPKPDAYRAKILKTAIADFEAATSEGVESHKYVIDKDLNVDGCDIRLVNGKLQYAFYDFDGNFKGFQTITSDGIKRPIIENDGDMSGAFVVIGDKSQVPFGAIFCEGLATGLKIYHSNSSAKGELKNNRQMPVVVCLSAGNMRDVVASHVAEYGAANVKIHADNDCGVSKKTNKFEGNTGIRVALEICKQFDIKSYRVPVSADGKKCDFADTLKFNDCAVPTKRTDYAAALLKVCPKQSIKSYWRRYAYALIENAPSELRSVDDCVNAVIAITELRGVDVKQDVHNLISRKFQQRLNAMRKLKTITEFEGITRRSVDGKTVADIATDIEFDTLFHNGVMTFDNRGMGSNKTTNMIELVNRLKGGIAYISPLTSVCKNAGDRLNFYDYQSTSTDFVNTYSHNVNLSVCINSIIKFNLAANFSHIFIDEAAAVYASIFDDTGTNSHQQAAIISALKSAIQAAKSVLIADAGLSDREVSFFKSLAGDKQITLIETTPQLSGKNHYLLKNHSHSHEFILRDIINGRAGVVACDSVAGAIAVFKYLKKHGVTNQIDINRVLLATGENNGEENVLDFIEKPNENAYRYDVVIHSPIIKSGTSIEFSGYSFAYLLYDGVVGTSDAMQMLGRCRNATDVYVSFGNRIDKSRVTDFELLLEADIESHCNQGYVLADNALATLRHEFTATKNADLNDFKNNFMLFAEITGRNFTRIESDIEIDKNLSIEVKASRVEDRLNAKVLTESEYQSIKNSNLRTQAQTDSMKRYDTVLMAYGANITSDSVITSIDVENELDGMTDVLEAFEFINKDTSELKALDKADLHNDTLKFSRVELQKALIEVLAPLQKASDSNCGIDKKTFNKACDKLEKHALILSLATFGTGNLRLGNFKKINRIRAGFIIGNLLAKIGYEMNEKKVIRGVSFYEIKVNDEISRYAIQRKGCS